jgi:hypothetical protein
MVLTVPEQVGTYKTYLVELMTFLDGIIYPKDFTFDPAALAEVTPDDVYNWMAVKVYGIPDPTPQDDPIHGRSSSLEYYKKALSYFMPHKLVPWNVITKFGNPTRSVKVNELI